MTPPLTPQPTARNPTRRRTGLSRRKFMVHGSQAAAGSALASVALPFVHAAEDNTIQLALIGCGGRGSGAAADAFESAHGPVKLVAMADFFEDRLNRSYQALRERYPERLDVPPDRRFVGMTAWRQAIDCLRPGSGDIAMLCGYAGFRPGQLEYAVSRGVNVFMEKSFATDPPGVRRVIQAGALAAQKSLKVAAGLQCRHSRNRQELIRRIRAGDLGELQLLRAYRMQACGWLGPRPADTPELHWQIRNFVHFYWVSGGLFAEMNIHQIDELCWLKDAWPVSAHGVGGRAAHNTDCGQGLDSFTVEWTFADGTKAFDVVRWLPKCHTEFATYVHGTRCAAQFSGPIHEGTVHIYKDQRCQPTNIAWRAAPEPVTPWQAEWDSLLAAIRHDLPHNEAQRAAYANLADIMGRAAVHMGRVVTWDEALESPFQFCPGIDQLTDQSPPPVQADPRGRYPVPAPGQWTEL
ncbi:MAG: Gfo/Idh/MocA family oxidoreductase [Verrucomicrobia bacterium]|nr:Gfo/Idh/MocA family oxidoreductase [Verrucomicrobiota bacterium]